MSQEELKLAFQTAGTSFDQLRDSFFMNGNGDAGKCVVLVDGSHITHVLTSAACYHMLHVPCTLPV